MFPSARQAMTGCQRSIREVYWEHTPCPASGATGISRIRKNRSPEFGSEVYDADIALFTGLSRSLIRRRGTGRKQLLTETLMPFAHPFL